MKDRLYTCLTTLKPFPYPHRSKCLMWLIVQRVLSSRFYYWNMRYRGIKNSKKKRMRLETGIIWNGLLCCWPSCNSARDQRPSSTWRVFCSSSILYVIKAWSRRGGVAEHPGATQSCSKTYITINCVSNSLEFNGHFAKRPVRNTNHAAGTEPPMSVRRFCRMPIGLV